jgi:hypothetical protein
MESKKPVEPASPLALCHAGIDERQGAPADEVLAVANLHGNARLI